MYFISCPKNQGTANHTLHDSTHPISNEQRYVRSQSLGISLNTFCMFSIEKDFICFHVYCSFSSIFPSAKLIPQNEYYLAKETLYLEWKLSTQRKDKWSAWLIITMLYLEDIGILMRFLYHHCWDLWHLKHYLNEQTKKNKVKVSYMTNCKIS